MESLSLVLAVASLLAAIYAFIRMSKVTPDQKRRFLVLGIALLGFTVLNTLQYLNASA